MTATTAAANRLVFDKKVKFVLGPGGFFGPAAAPVLNPNKVMYVLSYATTQPGALGADYPYGFLGNDASVGYAIVAMKAMKKEFPNAKKVALMMPDDGCRAVPRAGDKEGARAVRSNHGRGCRPLSQ